ncbi:rod shape-determining protein RodA [Candidatus Uhrbacteria bacterium]|nr:rod shape-determining protein RodA [Candidatus Uhrbacteria bacterium]
MVEHLRALWSRLDSVLMAALALLATFGLVGLSSLALRGHAPDFSVVMRQGVALGLGVIAFFVVARIDWRAWERWWPFVAVGTLSVLIAVLVVGARVHGTRGWLTIGSWTLQPVEFAKIGLIVLQAVYFRRRARSLGRLRTILESAAITAVIVVPVLLQPDLGSALVLLATWFGMLLVLGLRRAHLLMFALGAFAAAVVAWFTVLQPYQRERMLTFLDPNRDPQGAGYNQRQAVIAIGAGGWLGRGFGQGTQAQLRFLPEAQSDFLPAVVGEEFGFLGMAVLVVCLLAIAIRLGLLARRCPDDASAALVVGIAICFGVQSAFNLAMNLGVAPVMGVPFPFVSAGGSAILAFACAFGMVSSIAATVPRAEPRAYAFDVLASVRDAHGTSERCG